ncbi:putative glycine cleavage system transcriptional repressor [Methyloglobulus morosus KoM1]|uniref:Glycine cleavage system transcriptional repressor n=1 Tax=Methyloglobulus morosus KoM1 TaxID=1116472 RepID=V5BI15_9GAMM|nr:ACT domain-containing protein [Methyloglobulus morosus]ESS72950.1 putative glycine cleavage system transcriptional repressor [Methyloglobulus morosus KoM1]
MQLTITALGKLHTHFIAEILPTIRDCKCNVLEVRSSRLGQCTGSYLLIQGNWNQIAKVETALDLLQKRMEIKVHSLRTEAKDKVKECVPYTLETISLDKESIIESIISFLLGHDIDIEEITGSSYQAPYAQASVFSTKFVILVPPQIHLLTLREEFLDFCDHLNIDAILEPIKR